MSDDEDTAQDVKRAHREASTLRRKGLTIVRGPKQTVEYQLQAHGLAMVRKPRRTDAEKLAMDGVLFLKRQKTVLSIDD